MFGLGFTEIILVLVITLLVFGPKHMPELAKTIGRTMGELRRTLDDIKHEVTTPELNIKNEILGNDFLEDDTPVKKQDPKEDAEPSPPTDKEHLELEDNSETSS